MLTADETANLTWIAVHTRDTTHGCGAWDSAGTHKAVSEICGAWTYSTALDHVIAHARDPKARTPYAMKGTAPSHTPTVRHPYPLRAGDPDECPRHKGQHRDHCGPCAADRLAGEPAPVSHPSHAAGAPTSEYLQAREALRQ